MIELDIWRAVEQMQKLYGADAAIHAALRADKALAEGDTEGFSVWCRITTAIDELARSRPRDVVPLN
jgi:hypothetical protein